MAFFNDTYCQICERFITKEQGIKHLFSSRPLHREVNGYWPAYFLQRKMFRDEGSILENAFWEISFGKIDVLPVHGFLKTHIMMVTNMKDYVTLDPDKNDADFGYGYRDTIIAQVKQDLSNKKFSLQDQSKVDQNDTLQDRIKLSLKFFDMRGPIPDNLHDYYYNDNGLDHFVRGAEMFPDIREVKVLSEIHRYK